MAKCGCASDRCSCNFIAGDGIAITGTGSRSNPYVIESFAQGDGGGGGGGTVTRIPGEMMVYAGSIAPDGWLLCDGAEVNRSAYSDLFAAIGTAFGAGDGLATFNVPDMSAAFPRGTGGGIDRGESGGAEDATLAVGQLPSHTHQINHSHPTTSTSVNGNHSHPTTSSNDMGIQSTLSFKRASNEVGESTNNALTQGAGAHDHTVTTPTHVGISGATGVGDPVPIVPPYVGVTYLIKF